MVRAYAGLASTCVERTTAEIPRLTDEEWGAERYNATRADVPRMAPVIQR